MRGSFGSRMSRDLWNFGAERTLLRGVLLVSICSCLVGGDWRVATPTSQDLPEPEFDDFTVNEVEAIRGQTVLLPCIVRNLGDKVVSWIRRKDLQILTSGPVTFSADTRFTPVYSEGRDFWGLRIHSPKIQDTGQYECQVNSDPKIGHIINLTVTEASKKTYPKYVHKATITGPNELRVQEHTSVTLTCEITPLIIPFSRTDADEAADALEPKSRVQWFHGQRDITYQKRGISIITDYKNPSRITSRLAFNSVSLSDDGIYSCSYASTLTDSVRLKVVEDERPEAMLGDHPHQTTMAAKSWSLSLSFMVGMVFVLVLVCR